MKYTAKLYVFALVFFCDTDSKLGNGLDFSNHPNRDLLPTRSECGIRQEMIPEEDVITEYGVMPRIWGGDIGYYPGKFPWFAVIYPRGHDMKSYCCGGTVINSRYVLTAAHCLRDNKIRHLAVGLRRYNIDWEYDSSTLFFAESYTRHPDYNDPSLNYSSNDIALIRLDREIPDDDYYPICLPIERKEVEKDLEDKMVEVVGFGESNFFGTPLAPVIKSIRVPALAQSACLALHERIFGPNIMCAGGIVDGRLQRACNGDSGGPLLKKFGPPHDKRFYLYGIVKGGRHLRVNNTMKKKRCQHNSASAFTRVVPYMQWILDTIEE